MESKELNAVTDHDIRLIVGLGNPDEQYAHTRHNLGYDLLTDLAREAGVTLQPEKRFFALMGRALLNGTEVKLLFPTTYMNESGRAVGAVAQFFKLRSEQILVLHDDLDLKPGTLRLKFGGGFAGHRGLKSISACLANTQNFHRLKLGIGMPPSGEVINWVLGRPAGTDAELIAKAQQVGLEALRTLFERGLAAATLLANSYKPAPQTQTQTPN